MAVTDSGFPYPLLVVRESEKQYAVAKLGSTK
jgi:hypothetical protein